jgi:hypothetical protein
MFLLNVSTMLLVSINLQRNNECKGGMMEEWHQKLHNNTSPDDVVICQVIFYCPVIEHLSCAANVQYLRSRRTDHQQVRVFTFFFLF